MIRFDSGRFGSVQFGSNSVGLGALSGERQVFRHKKILSSIDKILGRVILAPWPDQTRKIYFLYFNTGTKAEKVDFFNFNSVDNVKKV